MDKQSIIYSLVGVLVGVVITAGAFIALGAPGSGEADAGHADMTMSDMTQTLKGKTGDEYDRAFLAAMIEHHQGALDMAKLSASSAKHDEIKKLSADIIVAQEREIAQMKRWQADWGYTQGSESVDHSSMEH